MKSLLVTILILITVVLFTPSFAQTYEPLKVCVEKIRLPEPENISIENYKDSKWNVCPIKINDDGSISFNSCNYPIRPQILHQFPEDQKKRIIAETKSSIDEWENMLKNSERINQKMWDIDIHIFDSTESFPSTCQVKIVFSPNKGDLSTLGTASTHTSGIVDIVIYYQQITFCQKTWKDEKYIYTEDILCYSDSTFTLQEIGVIVRHEFGHALGLDHYPLSTESVNPLSIMVIPEWNTSYMSRITMYDINSVRKIHPEGIASMRISQPTENKSTPESTLDQFVSVKQSIPLWVKNTAGWWVNGQIADSDYVSAIQFLIQRGIIKVDQTTKYPTGSTQDIPQWIRNNAKWWSEDMITETDFLKGIEYMVKLGIIKVN